MRGSYLIVLTVFFIACSGQQRPISTFNDYSIRTESGNEYSFLVGGHLYGSQKQSYYPANTLTSNIAEINGSSASFFVGLGDVIRETDTNQIAFFRELLTNNLSMPFYNAVGNHDVQNRKLYSEFFGETYFYFEHKNDLFVFLDTELDSARISGAQLIFLKKVLHNFTHNNSDGNVFVFMHKLIWNELPEFGILKDHTNQAYSWLDSSYYSTQLQPLFAETAKNNPVFIFSGDIGTKISHTLFYHFDDRSRISYIANGLGDTDEDALIQVKVSEKGRVSFSTVPLSTEMSGDLEDYGVEFWERKFQDNSSSFTLNVVAIAVSVMLIIALAMYRRKSRQNAKIA